jgi:UDP:flavonoid glycosyltransferase YjiC (YdhE family)
MNVVLFTSGSAGDILPFVRVGAALAARDHAVTLVSHARYERLAAGAGLRYEPFDTDRQYGDYLRHASLLNTPGGIARFLLEHSLPRAPAALERLTAVLDSNSLLLTCPTFDTAARIAAELHGLDPLWLFIAPVQISAWPQRSAVRTAMVSRVLGDTIESVRASAGLAPITDWDAWLRYSDQSIGQWPDWFASPDADWLPGVEPVGFLIDHPAERSELPEDVAAFIAAQTQAPLLVTGGTGRYLGEDFYAHALGAAAQLNLPAIVVTRDRDCLPEALPERSLVLDHLPFGVVMPHCSTVIHHGGLGTTGAAAAAGVPQLILAFGADRPDNGERITACGIGESILLPQCSVPAVVDALQRLTSSERLKERCRKASAKILAQDGASLAADLAEAFQARAANGN